MGILPGLALRITCIATLALAMVGTSGAPLRAQAPARSDTVTGTAASRPAASASTAPARPPAPASKPLSQKVFDTPWVLFPTRLAIVIVLLAVSALFLMSGCWGAVRLAHLLRHLDWKEPPRRLKRGELGAAGATFGWEFEERLNGKRKEDEERDRQIALLQESVKRLSQEQIDLISTFVNAYRSSS
jgi:hypothetical protein